MKIGILGSMQFSDQMIQIANELRNMGHDPVTSRFIEPFLGKTAEEQERIKIQQKNNDDVMRKDVENMKSVDAFLVLNFDKHGIKNYIGGNAFLEMGVAYFDRKKIFLYNDIPEIPIYKSEIEAMKPIIIYGDLQKISEVEDLAGQVKGDSSHSERRTFLGSE